MKFARRRSLALIDTMLDRSVIAGYTRLGYALRRAAWEEIEPGSLVGHRVVLSGASSGIGLAAAEGFAKLGAELVLIARDERRGCAAAARVAAHASAGVKLELCDLAKLASVRECARRLLELGKIDVLVNNAGVLAERYRLSEDGIELTFATNVLGPFLLTSLLEPALGGEARGRVITVSSGGMYTAALPSSIQAGPQGFDGTRVYSATKRQEVVLSDLWATRTACERTGFYAMHPGWVDTPGLKRSLPAFHRLTSPLLRDPAAGADTILWLATTPSLQQESGGFWHDRRRRPEHLLPWTRSSAEQREQLFAECERLSGLSRERRPGPPAPALPAAGHLSSAGSAPS